MSRMRTTWTLPVLFVLFNYTESFTIPSNCILHQPSTLHAKKKDRSKKPKGFGKSLEPPRSTSSETKSFEESISNEGLISIESTGTSSFATPKIEVDSNLPTEERTKVILKQQFGLRSFEEQQGDIKAAEKAAENRNRLAKLKKMKDEEFDIFMVIPPSVVKAIDLFLKSGLIISTILFVFAGVGITAEAWTVATGNKLPEGVDNFIVDVIEPNFTPGLFVLLSFSVSLGIFATAQLGSGSSVYKEEV